MMNWRSSRMGRLGICQTWGECVQSAPGLHLILTTLQLLQSRFRKAIEPRRIVQVFRSGSHALVCIVILYASARGVTGRFDAHLSSILFSSTPLAFLKRSRGREYVQKGLSHGLPPWSRQWRYDVCCSGEAGDGAKWWRARLAGV